MELHPDNVNAKVLQMLKDAGVTKISIGIQSFSDKYRTVLGRKKIDTAKMLSALSSVPFETVSMDFIFALPGQTYDDLKKVAGCHYSILFGKRILSKFHLDFLKQT